MGIQDRERETVTPFGSEVNSVHVSTHPAGRNQIVAGLSAHRHMPLYYLTTMRACLLLFYLVQLGHCCLPGPFGLGPAFGSKFPNIFHLLSIILVIKSKTYFRTFSGNNRWEIGTAGRLANPLTGIHLPPGTGIVDINRCFIAFCIFEKYRRYLLKRNNIISLIFFLFFKRYNFVFSHKSCYCIYIYKRSADGLDSTCEFKRVGEASNGEGFYVGWKVTSLKTNRANKLTGIHSSPSGDDDALFLIAEFPGFRRERMKERFVLESPEYLMGRGFEAYLGFNKYLATQSIELNICEDPQGVKYVYVIQMYLIHYIIWF
uniref:MATH domain-containing protein n=1 Tax=Heterorhabditis bacteriophora TaxID=37862 RepID=A0A1I7W899_HETBA